MTMTPNIESTAMTDRVVTTSQLSSIASTSSLPSLPSSPSAESDTHLAEPSLSALQPHEIPPTSRAERTTLGITTSRPQRHSPFESFSSSKLLGPFHPLSRGGIAAQIHLITALSFACLNFLHTASATAATLERSLEQQQQQQHRRLEEEEEEWTGEWNGEWTAPQDDAYVYECGDNCDDDTASSKASSMWLDGDPLAWTEDKIITYVSVGILSFMTLLCCVCYPEILVVTFRKLCGCCLGGSAAAAGGAGADGMDEEMGRDYVGGKQEKELKKKKKRRSRSSSKSGRSRSRSRSKSKSKNIELV
mmetsp:Transcript_29294/g.53595  ORF Transcript_29294/g.53595 Transcript_29294/m.53595 type:complete len:305 (-) Transcript_29294:218-1132(-)